MMKYILQKFKDILTFIKSIRWTPILVISMIFSVITIYLQVHHIINLSSLQVLALMFSPIIAIHGFFIGCEKIFRIVLYTLDFLEQILYGIEAFSIFRKRRKISLFKAFLFILMSKNIRKGAYRYFEQQLKSENKFFRKYYRTSKFKIKYSLLSACYRGDLEEVKYLLTSPELKFNPNINFEDKVDNKNALSNACIQGHLEIVKYLLFSKELKENISLKKYGDSAFCAALYYEQIHILEYLVFQAKIEKTEYIKKFIEDRPPNRFYDAERLFKMRDLKNDLNLELVNNPINKNKIIKI